MAKHMVRIDTNTFKELQYMKINGDFKSVADIVKTIVKEVKDRDIEIKNTTNK